MKSFETMYLCMKPFSPPLYQIVRGRLDQIVKSFVYPPKVADAGGRKSHYTIGVPADIIITDLPRKTAIQNKLNLGLTQEIVGLIKKRRSNVKAVLLDDMTHSSLHTESFDCLVAVEVLEHVEEDFLFVKEVARVLKQGGIFLMTTPNGDFVRKTNPDHKRHYTRQELRSLLESVFIEVQVDYAVVGGIFRKFGLKSYSFKHPLRTALMMVGNAVNSIQSARKSVHDQAHGTYHLIATARK